jgi:hypothetical protein
MFQFTLSAAKRVLQELWIVTTSIFSTPAYRAYLCADGFFTNAPYRLLLTSAKKNQLCTITMETGEREVWENLAEWDNLEML